jgi:hypothetical protein
MRKRVFWPRIRKAFEVDGESSRAQAKQYGINCQALADRIKREQWRPRPRLGERGYVQPVDASGGLHCEGRILAMKMLIAAFALLLGLGLFVAHHATAGGIDYGNDVESSVLMSQTAGVTTPGHLPWNNTCPSRPRPTQTFSSMAPMIGADDWASVPLPTGNVLWLLADTFVNWSGSTRGGLQSLPRNAVAIANCGTTTPPQTKFGYFIFYWRNAFGANAFYEAFFQGPGAWLQGPLFEQPEWYWPLDGIVINNTLFVLADDMVPASGSQRTFYGGSTSTGSPTTAATSTTISNSAANWTTNQWAGYTVEIVAGTAVFQTAVIASNTATQLNVSTWGVTPDTRSKFIILQPPTGFNVKQTVMFTINNVNAGAPLGDDPMQWTWGVPQPVFGDARTAGTSLNSDGTYVYISAFDDTAPQTSNVPIVLGRVPISGLGSVLSNIQTWNGATWAAGWTYTSAAILFNGGTETTLRFHPNGGAHATGTPTWYATYSTLPWTTATINMRYSTAASQSTSIGITGPWNSTDTIVNRPSVATIGTVSGTIGTANVGVITTSNTTGVAVGQSITGTGLPAGEYVVSFIPDTSITLTTGTGVLQKLSAQTYTLQAEVIYAGKEHIEWANTSATYTTVISFATNSSDLSVFTNNALYGPNFVTVNVP